MHRNQSVNVHQFAMVPRAEIPRSSFRMQSGHKTSFNGGDLIPVFVTEVLPGDTFSFDMTAFVRMATPIFPMMDNLHLDTFCFFVPNRLVWDNWQKFMGEQNNPGDSTSFTVPEAESDTGGYDVGTLQDYLGLPTVGQVDPAETVTHNNLIPRAYQLIWNEWFRDQNLQDSEVVDKDDGPDDSSQYAIRKRGKRHDYFTSCLPFLQKGTAVSIPLGTSAPVLPSTPTAAPTFTASVGAFDLGALQSNPAGAVGVQNAPGGAGNVALQWRVPGLIADLSASTAATINQLRQAFQIQKLLERDARGGTRYTEIVRAHFGVVSPDARLQRPEYLGGGSTPINITPVVNNTGVSDVSTIPQGTVAAFSATVSRNGFTQSFTEHGHIIVLCAVRADLSYQQGLHRMWSRQTKYDFYWPAFAMLGEQAVLNKEIFCTGLSTDDDVFGYQERWAEYRYMPPMITSLMRSTSAGTIDAWHMSEEFASLPVLNAAFIEDPTGTILERALAVNTAANGQQFIMDSFFNIKAARPMPLYSVPGMIDHF